jgi:hypothetical protein
LCVLQRRYEKSGGDTILTKGAAGASAGAAAAKPRKRKDREEMELGGKHPAQPIPVHAALPGRL